VDEQRSDLEVISCEPTSKAVFRVLLPPKILEISGTKRSTMPPSVIITSMYGLRSNRMILSTKTLIFEQWYYPLNGWRTRRYKRRAATDIDTTPYSFDAMWKRACFRSCAAVPESFNGSRMRLVDAERNLRVHTQNESYTLLAVHGESRAQ